MCLKVVKADYVICPVENRTALLYQLLFTHFDFREKVWNKKIIIIFSHDNCVRFHTELFQRIKHLLVMPLLRSDVATSTGKDDYAAFQNAETAALAISASVAQRLTNLSADIIVQYEPPASTNALRSLSVNCSELLLFLRPQETKFLEVLKNEQFVLEERYVPWGSLHKLPKVKIQQWYSTVHSMNLNSKAAYKAYLDSIRDHKLTDCFNLEGIVIREVADCYCLPIPPFYKIVNEKSLHEQNLERREQQRLDPVPPTAKVVKKSFKRVVKNEGIHLEAVNRKKSSTLARSVRSFKKHSNAAPQTEGSIDLSYNRKRVAQERRRRVKLVKKRTAANKGLRKMLRRTSDGGRIKLSVKVGKRRRPIK